MRRYEILLFDLDQDAVLATDLRKIIGGELGDQCRVTEIVPQEPSFASIAAQFRSALSDLGPDEVFLLLGNPLQPSAVELLRQSQPYSTRCGIIAVLRTGQPSEIFAVLEAGASDFLVPPLSPTDVLPRFWRGLKRAHSPSVPTQALDPTQHSSLAGAGEVPPVLADQGVSAPGLREDPWGERESDCGDKL